MGRYPEHPLAQMIANGQIKEARELIEKTIREAGSQRRAAPILNCSVRSLWRYMAAVGLNSSYDGREGVKARWSKEDSDE
jgi:hypothetical protein